MPYTTFSIEAEIEDRSCTVLCGVEFDEIFSKPADITNVEVEGTLPWPLPDMTVEETNTAIDKWEGLLSTQERLREAAFTAIDNWEPSE